TESMAIFAAWLAGKRYTPVEIGGMTIDERLFSMATLIIAVWVCLSNSASPRLPSRYRGPQA
ncbi:MAG: hypothetical protein ABF331_07755, partial [Hellea sp.]